MSDNINTLLSKKGEIVKTLKLPNNRLIVLSIEDSIQLGAGGDLEDLTSYDEVYIYAENGLLSSTMKLPTGKGKGAVISLNSIDGVGTNSELYSHGLHASPLQSPINNDKNALGQTGNDGKDAGDISLFIANSGTAIPTILINASGGTGGRGQDGTNTTKAGNGGNGGNGGKILAIIGSEYLKALEVLKDIHSTSDYNDQIEMVKVLLAKYSDLEELNPLKKVTDKPSHRVSNVLFQAGFLIQRCTYTRYRICNLML
ncbi:MAG: hypothetical protein AAF391_08935, partial [Bacteroidota bacterium]